jgi:hypothetical protein
MKRPVALMVLSLLCAGLVYGQGTSDMKVDRLGVVEVRKLPRSNPNAQHVRPHPVLPEDPELFQGEKLQAQNGVGGTPAPALTEPPSTLCVPTSLICPTPGFAGLTFSDTPGYVPPDTQVAAGSNSGTRNLVEMVNGTIRIFDGLGNTVNTLDMCSFFFCDFFTAVISDPIVRYDPASTRWFASVVTIEYTVQGNFFVPEGQWRLAVSQTSDPGGSWWVYGVTMSNGTFPDFPKLAISSDKVVQTGDAFTISTNRFKGTEFAVLSKADAVAGVATPGFQYFAPPQGLFALAAAELLPSSSITSTVYMAAVGSSRKGSSIRVWQLNGVPNTSGTGVTVTTTDHSTAAFATPPNAPQKGVSTLIDTNGNWLVDAFYQSGHLWVSANSGCIPAGDTTTRSCMRFVEISPGTATVTQDLTFGEKGEYYYYPAIRPDSTGNLIAVFNRSSSTEYVGVYASGQLTGAPNTFQMAVQVKAGETAYTASPPRWGDYSGASADPITAYLVWIAAQYAQYIPPVPPATVGGNQWGTWIAQVHF